MKALLKTEVTFAASWVGVGAATVGSVAVPPPPPLVSLPSPPSTKETLSITTVPIAAPKSKRTRLLALPKSLAANCSVYVWLSVLMVTSGAVLVNGSSFKPIPAKIGRSLSEEASKVKI